MNKLSMRPCVLLCTFLLPTVLTATRCSAGPTGMTVFDNGRAGVSIVLPVAATDAEKDAAGELKRFLDRASGASFRIVTEDQADTGLFVGRTKLARDWRLPPTPPTPQQDEGFTIEVRSDKKQAVIVGTIDMATKFAVYNFLDRFVGVRWFLPGRLFEVVPKHERLTLVDCRMEELPVLSGRKMGSAIGTQRSADEADPQFGTPFVDYSDRKGVRIDTSRRDSIAARWGVRNLQSVDGRLSDTFHGHHMARIFTPYYFQDHKQYYPKRYRIEGAGAPHGGSAAGWQPCTSDPGVLQVALDWGRDFYKNNPQHWAWFSLGINDGGGWCNCDPCRALDEPRGSYRGFAIRTDRYLKFVAQVASVMLEEFPDRKICLLLYSTLFVPPATMDKLPPNVVGVITRDSFQYHDPEYLAEDLAHDKRWLEVLNGNLYRYDYFGFGSLTPRYYPHRLAEDIRRMRDIGVQGVLAEDITVWPMVGPSYYVASKLWWNPDRDVDKLINEFHATLFGPAAAPMARYWDRHEKVWLEKRPGKWFEGLADMVYEARMYSTEDLDYLDRQFVEAYGLAGSDMLIRERIRFFEGGWKLAEHYIREYHLLEQMQAAKAPESTADAARQLLEVIHARRAYWVKYRQSPRFPGQERGPCEDYRYVIEQLGRLEVGRSEQSALSLVALRLASPSPEMYKALLAHYRARASAADAPLIRALDGAGVFELSRATPNLIRNPTFELGDGNQHLADAGHWVTRGAAQQWKQYVSAAGGSFSSDNGVARIHGTDAGMWIQTFPVKPGEQIIGTVEYRLRVDPPACAGLSVSWKDHTGSWLSNYQTVGFDAKDLPRADDWQKVLFRHVVPDGAATILFQFGAWRMKPGQVVEYRKPYFGKIAKP